MRNILVGLLSLGMSLAFFGNSFGQDAEYSQFYANPLYLNPALAGAAGSPRAILNYRNQFPTVNAFEQYAFSFDSPVSLLGGGIGIMAEQDNQGDAWNTTSFGAAYAYQLRLGDNLSIRPSLKANYVQSTLDESQLVFAVDQNGQPTASGETFSSTSNSYMDFSAGMLIYSSAFYAGIVADHLTEPQNGFIQGDAGVVPMKITAHVGSVIPVGGGRNSTNTVSPNLLFQTQGPFRQLNAGVYYNVGPIVVGGWFRYAFSNSDAFIALVGIQQNRFRMGYSYDFTISELRDGVSGAHEVSLSYEFNVRQRTKSTKWAPIDCPKF
ncbi:MAG: type IX secretion system PorP/SprF family membrane protein [Sphingobacteriales bacterium]|jgi:type IX secretion system PorP/SprF family membrane protein